MSANSISERVVKVLGSMVRVQVASIHNVLLRYLLPLRGDSGRRLCTHAHIILPSLVHGPTHSLSDTHFDALTPCTLNHNNILGRFHFECRTITGPPHRALPRRPVPPTSEALATAWIRFAQRSSQLADQQNNRRLRRSQLHLPHDRVCAISRRAWQRSIARRAFALARGHQGSTPESRVHVWGNRR
jgi:hypothetical protein